MRNSRHQMPVPTTRRWSAAQPPVTLVLVAMHLAAFTAQSMIGFLDGNQNVFQQCLALSTDGLSSGNYWQAVTFQFLHTGPAHLMINLAVLYLAGREVEPIIGSRHFAALYGCAGIVAVAAHVAFAPASSGMSHALVGASAGAVAVVAAFATILPELEVFGSVQCRAKFLGAGAWAVGIYLWASGEHWEVGPEGMVLGGMLSWFYVKRLGFGNPWAVQRYLRERRQRAGRVRAMGADEFIRCELDPILEKIAREGINSLTRNERRLLALGSQKLGGTS